MTGMAVRHQVKHAAIGAVELDVTAVVEHIDRIAIGTPRPGHCIEQRAANGEVARQDAAFILHFGTVAQGEAGAADIEHAIAAVVQVRILCERPLAALHMHGAVVVDPCFTCCLYARADEVGPAEVLQASIARELEGAFDA